MLPSSYLVKRFIVNFRQAINFEKNFSVVAAQIFFELTEKCRRQFDKTAALSGISDRQKESESNSTETFQLN